MSFGEKTDEFMPEVSAPEQPDAKQRTEALEMARIATTDGVEITPLSSKPYLKLARVLRAEHDALLAAEAELAELREEVLFLCDDEDEIRKGLRARAERAEARVKEVRGYLRDAMAWIHPPEMVGDWDLWLAALSEPTEEE